MTALLLALLAAAPAPDAAGTTPVLRRIYATASRAVVQVGDDPLHGGTVLSESGIIATTSDGIAGEASVPITFSNGFRATADVVAVDPVLDVALLRANGLPPMAYAPLSPQPVQVAQAAYALHLAKPLVPSVTFARVATAAVARQGRIDDRVFTARFALAPSARGGPVVSYAGQLLGILVTSDRTGNGFVLSSRALLALVAAHAQSLPPSELALSSDPTGAEVLLDGRPSGRTPTTLRGVPAGEHLLVLRAPGLPDAIRRLVALGSSHQDAALTLFPGSAVKIDAPEKALVYVDGILRARGAATLFLPGGEHVVEVTQPGFRPWARELEVVEDRPLELPVALAEQRATLSLESVPTGAAVMLDDNLVGHTPMRQVRVTPGEYAMSLSMPGFHTLARAVAIPDGLDVNLGKLALEPPHGELVAHVLPDTEVSLDGGPRHLVRPREPVPVGQHKAVFYAPYQYAVSKSFHVEDGQTVELSPVFVAAGDPRTKEVTHAISNVVEGAAGVMTLVSTGFFLAAESNRENNHGTLDSGGHSQISVGLWTGGIGLGMYGLSYFIDALQPTPEMGYDQTAEGAHLPPSGSAPELH